MLICPLTMSFGSRGDYKVHSGGGWHHDSSEAGYTWTSESAYLKLPLARMRRSLRLDLDLIPNGGSQDVFVFINGMFGAFWQINSQERRNVVLTPALLRAGDNTLAIVSPRAAKPNGSGTGGDQRVLGVAVRSLGLTETD